jgi:hypothetical protein
MLHAPCLMRKGGTAVISQPTALIFLSGPMTHDWKSEEPEEPSSSGLVCAAAHAGGAAAYRHAHPGGARAVVVCKGIVPVVQL